MSEETKRTKPIILLVDDDDQVRGGMFRFISTALRKAGVEREVEVWKTRSLNETIEQAGMLKDMFGDRGRFLLLTDGNMPGGNGDEVVLKLQALLGASLTSSAIMSANPDEFRETCKRLNVFCIEKAELGSIENLIQRFLDEN